MNEVPKEESPTLICLLPATEEGTIIVGASLDYAAEEAKAPAHWSALALFATGEIADLCAAPMYAEARGVSRTGARDARRDVVRESVDRGSAQD
jgi:hypothetical protein